MIKTLSKLGAEGNFLNMIKGVYEKPTATIVLIGEGQQAPPTSVGNKITVAIQHCARGLRAIRQEKEVEGINTGKEEVKLFVCR